MRAWAVGLLVCGLWGCAKAEPSPTASPDATSRPSAARMYRAAEALVEAGHYADGSRLMRHAILSLPRTSESDGLRHQLLMRMAHVQLLAAHHERSPALAADAASMLEAYGQRHLALFGDARAREREDIYELLYEAESFAEQLSSASEPEPDVNTIELAVVEQDPIDTHAGEDLEPEFNRDVRVRRGWFYDPDDPRIRARLESQFYNPFAGSVLTAGGRVELSPPRPLVRASGRPQRIGPPPPQDRDVRKLAQEILRASRPGLRDCYQGAAARGGKLETEATIELAVHIDGSINDVRVVEGDVVDGIGDACVIEHLAATTVVENRHAARLRIPLLFFYDGAQATEVDGGTPPMDGMDISDFAVQPS